MTRKDLLLLPPVRMLNNFRRLSAESSAFDFLVRPLAERLSLWPAGLTIDTTNRCNAKCQWCPHPTMQHNFLEMEWGLFTKIVDDYADRGGIIRFGNFGEPLMDTHFVDRAAYVSAKERICYMDMNTNFFLGDESKIKDLIELGMNFHISLDEVDEKLFKDIKGMEFNRVSENLMTLVDLNSRARNPVRIDVKIKSVQTSKELNENLFFQRLNHFASRGAVFLDIWPIAESDCINNMGGNFDISGFIKKYYDNDGIVRPYKNFNLKNTAPCSAFWRNMVITPDGKVIQCCVDIKKKIILGDLLKQSIEEIWQGGILDGLRRRAINRKRAKMELCQDCDLHQGWQYLRKYFSLKGKFYKAPHSA